MHVCIQMRRFVTGTVGEREGGRERGRREGGRERGRGREGGGKRKEYKSIMNIILPGTCSQ